MSRIARIAVSFAALTSLFALLSATAGASTWHNSGSTTFHATAGAGTLSSTSAGLVCPSGGTTTGTVAATPAVVPFDAWTAFEGTMTWTGCTLGVTGYAVDCEYALITTSWTDLTADITHAVASLTCGVFLQGTQVCHLVGVLQERYTNPSGATPGKLTIATGGGLTAFNGGVVTCPLGNGDRGHTSEFTFTLTSAAGSPVITRTA